MNAPAGDILVIGDIVVAIVVEIDVCGGCGAIAALTFPAALDTKCQTSKCCQGTCYVAQNVIGKLSLATT